MVNFVGNKKKIGIEYCLLEKQNDIRGSFKIWINNFAIGCPLDDEYFHLFFHGVCSLESKAVFYPELKGKTNLEIIEIMTLLDEKAEKYDLAIVHFGEPFDDYIIRIIRDETGAFKLIIAAKDISSMWGVEYNVISVCFEINELNSIIKELNTSVDLFLKGFVT